MTQPTTSFKVLLIAPPIHINRYKPRRACFPLGLAYLAGVLREHGITVAGLDCVVEGIDTLYPIDLPEADATPTMVNGLRPETIRDIIRDHAPDIVGINCSAFTIQQPAKTVARMAKEAGVPHVVLGGPHASGLPEYFLSLPDIDYVILGEGEYSFLELVQHIRDGRDDPAADIDGIACKKDGAVRISPKTRYIEDIDALPFPAWDLFPLEKYFAVDVPSSMTSLTGRSLEFMTSRGCPYECRFCASTLFNGPYRPRPAEKIIEEMKFLKQHYDVAEFHIVDDQLTLDRDRIIALCKRIIEEQLNIKWGVPNAIGPYNLDEEVISHLAQAGFYYTHLALESGNAHVLTDVMNKPTKLHEGITATALLYKYGIDVSLVFLVGIPGETLANIEDTFRYAARLPALEAFFYFATPLPGTMLYDLCRKERLIPDDFLDRVYDFQQPIITTAEWTPEQLKRFVRTRVIRLHLRYLLRNPFRFIGRYYRRYKKNRSVLKSFVSFIFRD